MSNISMPSSEELQEAVIASLKAHDGKATNAEIFAWTIKNLGLSQAQLSVMRAGNRSEIEYRLAWARTRASKKGLIYRISPSNWSLGSNK